MQAIDRDTPRLASTTGVYAWQRRGGAILLAALLVLMSATAARADSVKISGFWVDDVTIDTIVDGQIIFRPSGGASVEQPLAKLGGIKLDRVPQLAEAEQALADDQPAQAAEKLREAIEAARQPWARHFARKRLVDALSASGDAVAAVQAYLALARESEVEPALLDAPPVAVVRGADESTKQQVMRALDEAMPEAGESLEAHLQSLRDAAEQAASTQDDAAEPSSAVVLPTDIETNQATQSLRTGDFEAALAAAEQTLRTSGGLSMAFYQKGRAQLALAEQSDDEKLYKSAGLNFMRAVVYFPRSRYVGPSLVEAGYVHAKIGRPDLARKLYDRARIQIDEEENAPYHQRLMTLIQQLDNSDHSE